MRITYDSTASRFVAEFNPSAWHADKNTAKAAGFRCTGPDAGWVWYTQDAGIVLGLKGTAGLTVSKEAHAILAEAEVKLNASIQASRAAESDAVIPVPDGINPSTQQPFAYLPYQRAGIAYGRERQNVLIADEMGLGKTIQAVGIANDDKLTHRVLIICPSSLKLNWKKEWLRWDVKHLSVGLVSAGKKKFPETDVVVINYDLLGKWQPELRATEWDLMTIDECHYLKEGKTGRTQEVFGRKKTRKQKRTRTVVAEDGTKTKEKYEKEVEPLAALNARRNVFLTGTPIVNRPKELWPLVQRLDPNGLGANWKRYADRYCAGTDTRFGYDWSGSSNLAELQTIMRSKFMIRRLKRDVLKELPAKRRQIVSLEVESSVLKTIIEKEKKTYDEFIAAHGETESETPAFSEISRVRKETAVAKIPYVIENLREMLDANEKIVVMAHHHEVVDSLADALREFGVVSVDGRTPNQDRDKAVEAFQDDPNVRVFVGTIKAAGVGLTLTAASVVVFAELDWVPGNVTQAEDRVHRIGQRNAVMIYHLVLENSLDERMVEIIIGKQKVIDDALDTEGQNAQLPLPEISEAEELKKFEKPAKSSRPMKSVGLVWGSSTSQSPASINATATIDPVVASVPAPQMSPYTEEQTAAIHAGLRHIAGACDGAAQLDGSGFNKMDTNFGKSLAAASRLTPKMAVSGFNLVRKYRRQVPDAILDKIGLDKRKVA